MSRPAGAGFFIPHRHAGATRPEGYPELEPLFRAAEPEFRATVSAIAAVAGRLAELDGPPPVPRFDQDWFPRLDAAAAYALVRRHRPRRIVEVGSGHSTRFLAQAVRDGGLACRIDCVDPAPRADLAGLPVVTHRYLLHDAPDGLFDGLAADDVVFVDSSHVAQPGTDVDRLIGRVLPRLPAGVLVHFHDVFLPDPYPAEWAWRGYNEQIVLAALLQGGAFRPVFASRYAVTRRPEWLDAAGVASLPLVAGARESSLWLRKAGAPPLDPAKGLGPLEPMT